MRQYLAVVGVIVPVLSGMYPLVTWVDGYFAKTKQLAALEVRVVLIEERDRVRELRRLNLQIERYENEAKQRALTNLEERQLRSLRAERDALLLEKSK